ncbi:GlxA family transcriptional regulator [Litoribacillus peritrichatus]|uniref:HTH araC/xylS-type domain-containing protein n=1 Tax=Litoribacillus peritrichatus TaxID=718191 RepID=A0ABP7MR55_9GAMM
MQLIKDVKPEALKPVSIQVLVADRCQASGIFSLVDTLIAANYCLRKKTNLKQDAFPFKLIGTKREHTAYNGFQISNIQPIDVNDRPDILVIPGMIEATANPDKLAALLTASQDRIDLIKRWHRQGTVIVASCSGNFLIAASNIAQERTLTTHWMMDGGVRQLFSQQPFDMNQMMIDHGDIISFGGATAVNQMTLYLVERFHSRELALQTGRMMLIEPTQNQQTPFSMFMPSRTHEDAHVEQLQSLLENNFQEPVALPELMKQISISERQLSRRFKSITGETPISYLQRLRIEFVRRGLESTNKQANSLIWDAGYEDVSSFRRLFKKTLGMTMSEYRQRYGVMHRNTPVNF